MSIPIECENVVQKLWVVQRSTQQEVGLFTGLVYFPPRAMSALWSSLPGDVLDSHVNASYIQSPKPFNVTSVNDENVTLNVRESTLTLNVPLNAAAGSMSSDYFLSAAPILADLKKRATELQILPSIAIKAMEIARKPDCSISEYSSLVERDLKLTTEVLKLANSALYSPSAPIVSLHQAVLRLGLVQCQNLILTASITSMMKRISSEHKVIREVLSRHGFTTAVIALQLNLAFRFCFLGEEFTAGLIHDIGRTLLAITRPVQFLEIDPLRFEMPDILDRERLAVGTDHCLLGACFAIYQQLPDPLQEVILFHHQPERAKDNQKLTALIAVADHMANHVQRCNEAGSYEPSSNPFLPTLAKFADHRFPMQFATIAALIMEEANQLADEVSKA